ncbi:hypothetical protein THIOM_001729 [Candidatus Thiomargarita nelsonii]|uniref:Cytosolic protein n=1 Tax=Candidatus Thiomargarita nelsonii TaxID=1003181 RepID=A0A176S3H8_9GAMM|nr:hypothetical protein THIOM_001729 [Candidatus Thiomargarita nelsonii]
MLECFFESFMLFFFPQIHKNIDWSRGHEFLDKELQKVVREAITKERRVDKLVKACLKSGKQALLYIHIEVQGQFESAFSERVFIYHYRLYDRYGPRIVSLAILGDNDDKWQPESYNYENFGCELSFKFPVIKLSDYRSKWEELERSNNPFSIIVRTHLKGLETHNASRQRCHWKIQLYKALYEANYSKKEILELYRFLDWVMTLPKKYARQFDDFVEQYEEAKKVEYVTSIEKRGIEKGRLDGQRVIVENLLKSRFGGLDERLAHVIEPLLQLSPDESSRLLLQSSREELLARFLH